MLVKDRSCVRSAQDAQDMSVEFSGSGLYEADLIDVGIVLPTKAITGSVRTGVATYEGLSSLRRRHGRGMPVVPLVLIAIKA